LDGQRRFPGVTDPSILESIDKQTDLDADTREEFKRYFSTILRGLVAIGSPNKTASYLYRNVGNLHLSECFVCGEVAIWVDQQIVFRVPAPLALWRVPNARFVAFRMEAGELALMCPIARGSFQRHTASSSDGVR
jgi:hypothetical protein